MEQRRIGRSYKEISSVIRISPNTVKCHLRRAYEKLGAHSSLEALHRLAA